MAKCISAAFLSIGYLIASPALASEDLVAKAKQLFEPIPTAPSDLPGNPATPAKARAWQDALLRPPTVRKPCD